jgi:hypothetical protein
MLRLHRSQVVASGNLRTVDAAEAAGREALALLALLDFAILMALYFLARQGGHWAENDTAYITQVIRTIAATGTLTPTIGTVYPQSLFRN